MKKKLIIGLIIFVCIIVIVFFTKKLIDNKNEKITPIPVDYAESEENEEKNQQEQEKIIQITENQGFQADENIYKIENEYDGREVAVIKPNIKYQVALAGMIKKEKPEYSELNDLLNKAPKHTGIWIAENSREKFLNILKNIANANYEINEDGFLIQTGTLKDNKYDKKIKKMLSDEKLHIFDINSITYIVDEVTGEIQEYPFEEMDSYSEYEYFSSEDKEMFIISKNFYGKINQEEILKNIFK